MKKGTKIVIIGIVLLLVVGGVLYFVLGKKDSSKSKDNGITFKYVEHECRGKCNAYNYFITLEVYKDNVLIPYTDECIVIYQDGLDKNINPYPTVINEKGEIVFVPEDMDTTNKFKLTNMAASTYKIGNNQYRIDGDKLYYFVSDGCNLLKVEEVLIYGDLGKIQEMEIADDSYEVIAGKWCEKDI